MAAAEKESIVIATSRRPSGAAAAAAAPKIDRKELLKFGVTLLSIVIALLLKNKISQRVAKPAAASVGSEDFLSSQLNVVYILRSRTNEDFERASGRCSGSKYASGAGLKLPTRNSPVHGPGVP